jgi:hypothetical protein
MAGSVRVEVACAVLDRLLDRLQHVLDLGQRATDPVDGVVRDFVFGDVGRLLVTGLYGREVGIGWLRSVVRFGGIGHVLLPVLGGRFRGTVEVL